MACVGAFNKAATSGNSQAVNMLGALTEAIEPRRATRPANSSAVCDTQHTRTGCSGVPCTATGCLPRSCFLQVDRLRRHSIR
jgi:hypothetical protein